MKAARLVNAPNEAGAAVNSGELTTPENKKSYEAHLAALPLQRTQNNMRNTQLESCYRILSEPDVNGQVEELSNAR